MVHIFSKFEEQVILVKNHLSDHTDTFSKANRLRNYEKSPPMCALNFFSKKAKFKSAL